MLETPLGRFSQPQLERPPVPCAKRISTSRNETAPFTTEKPARVQPLSEHLTALNFILILRTRARYGRTFTATGVFLWIALLTLITLLNAMRSATATHCCYPFPPACSRNPSSSCFTIVDFENSIWSMMTATAWIIHILKRQCNSSIYIQFDCVLVLSSFYLAW